ncbi:hypothetical protein RFI_26804, partial [Reticulomyxa filosa]
WKEVNLTNVNKVCNWSLKLRYFKVDLTKKEILKKKDMAPQFRPEVETLQQWLSVCQDSRILTMITVFKNFEQLDEQKKDNIVTKKHHEPASLNIFSNNFVNKATLDQIAKGCVFFKHTYILCVHMCDQIHWERRLVLIELDEFSVKNHNDNNYFTTNDGLTAVEVFFQKDDVSGNDPKS